MVDTPARAVAGHGDRMETAWRQYGDRMEAAYICSGQGAVWYGRGRVAARLPAKPTKGLAISQRGLIVLKLNKKLLGAAGALVTAVSLTVTGLTAASASSTGSSGTEFLQ